MNFPSLFLELLGTAYAVDLLSDLSGCAGLVSVEDHISTAEAFDNLDKAELESRTQLVQTDGYIRVLFLVLVIVWQNNLGAREVLHLALRAVRTHIRNVHTLISQHEVCNVVELGEIRHFLVVHKLLDASVHCTLAGTHAVVTKLYEVVAIFVYQVKQDDPFARTEVHALYFNRREH